MTEQINNKSANRHSAQSGTQPRLVLDPCWCQQSLCRYSTCDPCWCQQALCWYSTHAGTNSLFAGTRPVVVPTVSSLVLDPCWYQQSLCWYSIHAGTNSLFAGTRPVLVSVAETDSSLWRSSNEHKAKKVTVPFLAARSCIPCPS